MNMCQRSVQFIDDETLKLVLKMRDLQSLERKTEISSFFKIFF